MTEEKPKSAPGAQPPDPEPLEILLIEDNPGDSRLFQESLTKCEIPCRVSLLTDFDSFFAAVHSIVSTWLPPEH